MLGRPDWSASVERGDAENYSAGSVHQELHSVISCHPLHGEQMITVAGSAVSPTLAMGMQAVSLDVPQMLPQSHQHRSTKVRHQDPPWELWNQPRPWPHPCVPTLQNPQQPLPGQPCTSILLGWPMGTGSVNLLKSPGTQLGFQPCLHLGAICLCLRALRTCGGRATPSVNKPREWGCSGGPLPSLWGCVDCGVFVVDLGSVAHTPSREYHSPVPHTSYFGLFLCIQPQSSPQVCPLKPEFQHPANPSTHPLTSALHPHTLADTLSQAEQCSQVTWTLCAGLSLFCLLQSGYCILLLASEAPCLSQS